MSKYEVVANVSDGNDYIEHYDGGTFDSYEEAFAFWDAWWPDMGDVHRVVREDHESYGTPLEEYYIEIGLWDEHGNECEFYSESIRI